MAIIPIEHLDDPLVAPYRDVKDRDLRDQGSTFMVEGTGTLRTLIHRSNYAPESLLLSPRVAGQIGPELEALGPEVPVYVAAREALHDIVGFDLHRGCLALCRRREIPDVEGLLAQIPEQALAPGPLLVLEGISNHDNVGGLFRNAQAFGVEGVVLCPRTQDPLYRKAIRTSLGGTLCVPFARATDWPGALDDLQDAEVELIALHPDGEGPELRDWTPPRGRFAIMVGTEGAGLSQHALEAASTHLHIAMVEGMDSVNVALAAGIALHHVYAERVSKESTCAPS